MNDTSKTLRRLKRSRVLHVSSLMATASFTLAACGSPANAPASAEGQWEETPTPFQSVEACVASGETAEDCQTADKLAKEEALASSPRFQSQKNCETEFGEGQCEQKTNNGTSFFMPMLAGFMLARMMNGNQMAAQPLYRDCRTRNPDGSCNTRAGGAAGAAARAFTSTNTARSFAGERDSRRSSIQRGGFGGSSRGYYGG